MARALEVDAIAEAMVRLGLASEDGETLAIPLQRLAERADQPTLLGIARVLLEAAPPAWLAFAVSDGQFIRENVPCKDLECLAWIGDYLEGIILDAHAASISREESNFLKAMGDAAELFVMAALRSAGMSPLHVSRISDAYGYDIECQDSSANKIEVKSATQTSQGCFHISRNEFEKSIRYGAEWRLVQVIFSPAALVAERLDASHVKQIRELRHGVLQSVVPTDTPLFKWSESAVITPCSDAWQPFYVALDRSFSTEGFSRAARQPR